MAYYLPRSGSSLDAAIIQNRDIDGSRGVSLVVFTDSKQARLRTRLRNAAMRERSKAEEIETGTGQIMILPAVLADEDFWTSTASMLDIRLEGRGVGESDIETLHRTRVSLLTQAGFEDREPEIIGRNRFGLQVFERVFGRTAHEYGRHPKIFKEWATTKGIRNAERQPDMFFRAFSPEDVFDNARSVIGWMNDGLELDHAAIERVSALIATESQAVSPRLLTESLEAQATRAIAVGEIATRGQIAGVMQAFPAQRERNGRTIQHQQYSTPYPFGEAATAIFGDLAGKRVLDPTIGNGALVASAVRRGAIVHAVELDHERFERATLALGEFGAEILQGDFTEVGREMEPGFEMVFINPPFGATDKISIQTRDQSFSTTRLHHQIAIEAIEKLAPGGHAFVVMPADFINPQADKEGAKRFTNWMRLGFDEVETVTCDARLYRGMGANVPVVIYAAKGFRETFRPFSELGALAEAAGERDMLMSYDDLYGWADKVGAAFGTAPIQDMEELIPRVEARPGEVEPVDSPEPTEEEFDPWSQGPSEPEPRRPAASGTPAEGEGGGLEPETGAGEPVQPARQPEPEEGSIEEIPGDDVGFENIETEIAADLWLFDTIDADDVQVYMPFSEAGTSSTVIPKSLSGPIYKALRDLEDRLTIDRGERFSVDDLVAENLGISKEELLSSDRLSPEQIDALALMFSGIDDGKGVLLGDLMGVGKGRSLAAVAEAALKSGDPVLFSSIKPELFSDFLVRDLRDVSLRDTATRIKNGEINLHIINSNTALMDRDVEVYRQGMNTREESGFEIAPDVNVIATTYSQFQKLDTGSERLAAVKRWLDHHIDAGRRPRLLLDESHRAASPSSNTGALLDELCRYAQGRGASVLWSSATGIKTGEHIELYYPALPDTGLGKMELLEVMASRDSLALQEALAHEMAHNGSLIVRQLADTGVDRDLPRLVDFQPSKIRDIREKVDQATSVLRDIIEFMPSIAAMAEEEAKDRLGGQVDAKNARERLHLETNSPVSNLHHFSGYLTLSVRGQFLPEMLTDAIARGEKPTVAVEHVGSQVLHWKMSQPGAVQQDGARRYLLSPPNLGDVLKRYVDNATTVKAWNGFGERAKIDLAQELEEWRVRMHQEIDDIGLNAFRIDGADLIHDACAKLGLSSAELTGRTKSPGSIGVGPEESGRYYLYEIDAATDASVNIQNAARFNDGEIDVLALNRAASSGISLHASPYNGADCRRRSMVKLELQADIVDERQIEGRIKRKGQVEGPRYVTPLTGFASDDRLASLFNRKNRSLSASTNATRENRTTIEEVVDLMNPVGRVVVYDYLARNPLLAASLDIEVNKMDMDGLVRKLMGRLVVRPLDEQQYILGEIDVTYRMQLDFLDRRGMNPLRNTRLDWKGRVVEEEVVLAENRAEGIAAQPVKLAVIEAPVTVQPISFGEVEKQANRNLGKRKSLSLGSQAIDRIKKAFGKDHVPDLETRHWKKLIGKLDKSILKQSKSENPDGRRAEFEKIMLKSLRGEGKQINRKDPVESRIHDIVENARFLRILAQDISIGTAMALDAEKVGELADTRLAKTLSEAGQDGVIPAVVVDSYCSALNPLDPDQWSFIVAVPGEASPISIKVGNMIRSIRAAEPDLMNWSSKVPTWRLDAWAVWASQNDVGNIITSWLSDEKGNDTLFQALTNSYWDRQKNEGGPSKEAPLMVNRPEHAVFMNAMFDRAVAGKVIDRKHVMTGNMFRALVLTQEGRQNRATGTKIMFSTEDGHWHHGIELPTGPKNSQINRLRDKGKVAAISSPTISSKESLSALGHLVMGQHYRWGRHQRSPMDTLDQLYGEIGGDKFSNLVQHARRADGFQLFNPGEIRPVSAMFVGPDIFSAKLLETKIGATYKGLNPHAGIKISAVDDGMVANGDVRSLGAYSFLRDSVNSAVGLVQRDMKRGELYYFASDQSSCAVLNPRNEILQEEFPDLMEIATNQQLLINDKQYRASAGIIAIALDWRDDFNRGRLVALHDRICEALQRLSTTADQPVLLSGLFRDFTERLDKLSFDLGRRMAVDHDLKERIDIGAEVQSLSDNAGENRPARRGAQDQTLSMG